MSKPKYPFEKRLEVVNHYFTTDDGYRIISARFGVPRTQVRTWVALYEKHGEKGLIPKPKGVSADPELRIKVVKAVIDPLCFLQLHGNPAFFWRETTSHFRLQI